MFDIFDIVYIYRLARLILPTYLMAPVPPSESEILSKYLLSPARLDDALTLEQFRSFFPRQAQASPLVKSLFLDLQHQRNVTIDKVSANIKHEAERGKAQRREVARARREERAEEYDEEMEIERVVSVSVEKGACLNFRL